MEEFDRPMTPMEVRMTAWLRDNPEKAADIARRANDVKRGENITIISDCGGVAVHNDLLGESDVVFDAWLGQDG